jgi:hypothetical protein
MLGNGPVETGDSAGAPKLELGLALSGGGIRAAVWLSRV